MPYRTEGPPPPPPPAPPVCVSYLFRRWLHRPRPRFALPPPPLPSSLPACLARAPRRVVGRPSVADPAPGGPVQVRLLPPFFALIGRTRCVGTRFQANLWSSSSGLGGDSDFNGDDGAGGGREGGRERAKGHFALGSVCPQPRGRGGV